MSKDERLRSLLLEVKSCKKCPFCYTRDQPSFSRGDPRSPLMIIGDIPRQADHKSGEVFSGRAGKKIDELLTKAGMKPEHVYFTTLLKCFPGRMGHFPEDNTPSKCYPWLATQIEIVDPKLVILTGPEAAHWILFRGTDEIFSDDWIGVTIRRRDVYGELRFMVIPHPSALAKEKNLSLEDKCVKALTSAKEYIVSRQNGTLTPHIEVMDIKKKIVHSRKDQVEGIKWVNPVLAKKENKEPPKT